MSDKCKTCGGSEFIPEDQGHGNVVDIPCPDCQQGGELVKDSYCKIHDTFPADNEPCWQCINKADKRAADRIEVLEKACRWIPVTEKPKKRGYYLIVIDRTKFGGERWWCVAWWTGVKWDKGAHPLIRYLDSITHWKPITLPAKAALEEKP